MASEEFSAKRRTSFPLWASVPAYALVYGLGVPIVKTLEAFGHWPGVLSGLRARIGDRARTRMGGGFGDYRPSEHDVFACSYAKSGTNWLLQMTTQIAGRGQGDFGHIHDVAPWPDFPGASFAIPLEDEAPWRASPTGLRVIKTHSPASEVPYADAARYIVVVRDPKSVCVSAYYFTKALMFGPLMPSIEHWADFFMKSGFPLGDWAEHVAGYWALRERPNVLFLTYEQMVRDARVTVERLAGFMGVDLTPAELDRVVHLSSFDHMKSISTKFDFFKATPWSKAEGAMIRRGQRGASGELLSSATQARLDDYFRAELRRLDCDFPYDEAFGPAA